MQAWLRTWKKNLSYEWELMAPRYVYDKPLTVRFLERSEMEDERWAYRGLFWYTDGSKTKGTGSCGVWLWHTVIT
jgi:hypothetical protein